MENEEEHSSRGGLQSSCPICLLELRLRDKVSALNCGHVFHFGCINQWLDAKKQCPSCRKVVPRSGFIEKLFFNVVNEEERNKGVPQIDYEEEASRLTAALATEKEKHKTLEEDNKSLRLATKSLEKKILKEKDKTKHSIPRLEAMVENLKIVADEVPHLQREVAEVRNKLKAADFYKVLNSYNEDAEKKLSAYLKKNGSLDTEKFFELLKAQNKELTEIRRQSRKTIEKLTEENNNFRKTILEKDGVIGTLKNNVLDLRDRANVQTPMNKRLQKVIDGVPGKRNSMGFDDTLPMDEDVMKDFAALHNENSEPSTSKIQTPVTTREQLHYDSDEEYFTVPKTVKRDQKPNEKAPSAVDDPNEEFSFDIDIPSVIVNRMPPTIKKIPVLPRKKSDPISNGLVNKTMHRSLSTSVTTIKPNLMKRKLSDESKPSKSTNKPPAVKSARLSSFYKRVPSTATLLDKDEFITLE